MDKEAIKEIIDNVGGEDNIKKSLALHDQTSLRFI